MSPTLFYEGPYRFFFFSREERRMHVHVMTADGEAKLWLEPDISLAKNHGLSTTDLTKIEHVIRTRENEIKTRWKKHFKS